MHQLNFNEWLTSDPLYLRDGLGCLFEMAFQEMAMYDVLRLYVPLDQEDADFLMNYNGPYPGLEKPPEKYDWANKLAWRYGSGLKYAIKPSHDKIIIRKGTPQTLRKVIAKLRHLSEEPTKKRNQGFDLRNIEPDDPTKLAGLRLMHVNQAKSILNGANKKKGWIRWSAEQRGIDVEATLGREGGRTKHGKSRMPSGRGLEAWIQKTGFQLLPLPLLSRSGKETADYQSYDPNRMDREVRGHGLGKAPIFSREELEEDVNWGIDVALKKLRRHHSYPGMLERREEIFKRSLDHWLRNTRDPNFLDRDYRRNDVMNWVVQQSSKDWGAGSEKHIATSKRRGTYKRGVLLKWGKGRPRNDRTATLAQDPNQPGAHLINSPLHKQPAPEPTTACPGWPGHPCGGTEEEYDNELGPICKDCGLPVMAPDDLKRWLRQNHGKVVPQTGTYG